MKSPVYKFFTQGPTAEYLEALKRTAERASYEQFISVNHKYMLIGDIIVRLEMDGENIYTPKDLANEATSNKLVGGLLANALIEVNRMTVEELAEFKIKWANRTK